MNFVLSFVALFAFCGFVAASDHCHKAKGQGAFAFAKAKSQCCNPEATEPAKTTVPEAPKQTGTVTVSSANCADGQCSAARSSGIFRRRR